MRLCRVSYRFSKHKTISGLQLHFNNGVDSPKFESKEVSKWGWQSAEIDPMDRVGKIDAYVCDDQGEISIKALRFYDQAGVIMQVISMALKEDLGLR